MAAKKKAKFRHKDRGAQPPIFDYAHISKNSVSNSLFLFKNEHERCLQYFCLRAHI